MGLTPQRRLLEALQVDVNIGLDGLDRDSLRLGGLEGDGRRAGGKCSEWVSMMTLATTGVVLIGQTIYK